jgi:Luciferase-like monooxygenase
LTCRPIRHGPSGPALITSGPNATDKSRPSRRTRRQRSTRTRPAQPFSSTRNPGILAKIVTTLDVISRGRAILGIGGAWYGVEHQGLGIDYPGDRVRLDMLEEAVQVCRAMFTGDDVSFTGDHYRLEPTRVGARPGERDASEPGPGHV